MGTLASDIEKFLQRHDMVPTRFGLLALNDKAFVGQVRNGRRIWPETEAKVRQFMDEYRPAESAAT